MMSSPQLQPPDRLPQGVDRHHVSCATVTPSGAKITIAGNNVTLTVPQGGVSAPLDLFVSILINKKYRPNLDNSQTVITPVVLCGPSHLSGCLQKPVVVSIPHTGGASVGRFMVLFCRDVDMPHAEWEIVSGIGTDNSDRLDMQVDSSSVHLVTENLGAYVLVANITDLNQIGGMAPNSTAPSSSGYASSSFPVSPDGSQKLSLSTKQALCRTLDVPSCEGRGWQQLAEVLEAEHFISFFASQPSPSEALLNLWEAKNKDPEPLVTLARMLKIIKREDAVVILERDLKNAGR